MARQKVDAKDVEFLSSSAGRVEDKVVGLITLRLEPGKFTPTTILLSEEQIIRLRDDLMHNFPRTEYPSKYWDG